ncbi:unnamed protein product, partial [Discosporangium mesarthrocarpum]
KDCRFIDGTLRPHCRPIGDVAQAATFSGYRRRHVIKFQGVVPPNGPIDDLWGPTAESRHGDYLMRRSRLDDRLRDAQEGNPTHYYAYGDTAYAVMSHVKRGFKQSAAGLQPESIAGKGRSECALTLGGKVCNLWGFLYRRRNLKITQNPVGDIHLVGVFLTNIRTRNHGSQVTEYCCEFPPSVEAYFRLYGHRLG